uniref:DNA polymerase processivity factor n=1 Tax=Bovine alphaherpesvirus 2 TaxID=10295 RepID=Q8JMJ0_9ALPH|nr:DNA polymerase processivity factor [Bovine alphaherpesvirus 2]
MCDQIEQSGGLAKPRCHAVIHGQELALMLQAFAPLRTSLLDSLLLFGERGLIIHSAVFGEQVYMRLDLSMFSTYQWEGPPAAFMSIVDQKQSLLGVFRANQGVDLRRVEFEITGDSPFRTLTRRVWTNDAEGGPDEPPGLRLMKREVTSFSVMVPQGKPDVLIRLTRSQLAKVVAIATGESPRVTFELSANKKFSVFSQSACVTFAVRESSAPDGMVDQAQVLSRALGRSGQSAAAAKTVYGDHTHRAFSATLDTENMRSVLRRLQVGGAALKFFLGDETPSVCVTATGPSLVSAIFMLKPLHFKYEWPGPETAPDVGGSKARTRPRSKPKQKLKPSNTTAVPEEAIARECFANSDTRGREDEAPSLPTRDNELRTAISKEAPLEPSPAKKPRLSAENAAGTVSGGEVPRPLTTPSMFTAYFTNPPRIIPWCKPANQFDERELLPRALR